MRAVIRKRWIGRLLRELVRQDGNVRFVALAPPSDEDVLAVLRRMVVRLERLLRPRLASAEDDARPLDALVAAQVFERHPEQSGSARRSGAAGWHNYDCGYRLFERRWRSGLRGECNEQDRHRHLDNDALSRETKLDAGNVGCFAGVFGS